MKNKNPLKNSRGFTLVEVLITLAIMAIAFLPMMQMLSLSLTQSDYVDDLSTARYLAQEGMEKIKNFEWTKEQVRSYGDVWEPSLNQPAFEMNKKYWRTLRKLHAKSDPLEIRVQVYRLADAHDPVQGKKPVTELITLMEDFVWG